MESTRRRAALAVAGVSFAIYALPLFWPPAAQPSAAPATGAGLIARVFPGVPPLWVAVRLSCLLLATVLAARALPSALPLQWPSPRVEAAPGPGRRALGLALLLSALQSVAGLFVSRLGRREQSLYFALFLAPAFVLWVAAHVRRRRASGTARSGETMRGAVGPVLAVLVVWLLSRLPDLISPVRAADPVDTWLSHEWIVRAASDGRNLLTQGFLPGLTCIYMFLEGVSFFGTGGFAPSLAWLQMVHTGWCLVTGIGIAVLATRLLGPAVAPVAAASFLFSPFVLLQPLVPAPYVLGPLFTAGLALLLVAVHADRSIPALAALGALAGVAATSHPPLAPVAGLSCLAAAISCWRAPRLPWPAYAIPLLSLMAAALPALPDRATLQEMREEFTRAHGQWAGLESVLLGQRDPYDVPGLWKAGAPGILDVPLGSLLAPFAIPRTPLRAWGDALFEPVGAALAALGIALALRRARHDPGAQALLVVLAVGILPGFFSSYDRPSHTRLFVAQVPLALLAGLGFETLRRTCVPGRPARNVAGVCALAMAAGGLLLFDVVNPRILASSSLGIVARALRGVAPPGGVSLLVFGGRDDLSWLHEESISWATSPVPIPVVPFTGEGALLAPRTQGRPVSEVLLFGPALEAREGVRARICARWPGAALYELRDRAGLSRAFAARPAGPGWEPSLPPAQWRLQACPAPTPPG